MLRKKVIYRRSKKQLKTEIGDKEIMEAFRNYMEALDETEKGEERRRNKWIGENILSPKARINNVELVLEECEERKKEAIAELNLFKAIRNEYGDNIECGWEMGMFLHIGNNIRISNKRGFERDEKDN
jgi:hypothetical protein